MILIFFFLTNFLNIKNTFKSPKITSNIPLNNFVLILFSMLFNMIVWVWPVWVWVRSRWTFRWAATGDDASAIWAIGPTRNWYFSGLGWAHSGPTIKTLIQVGHSYTYTVLVFWDLFFLFFSFLFFLFCYLIFTVISLCSKGGFFFFFLHFHVRVKRR